MWNYSTRRPMLASIAEIVGAPGYVSDDPSWGARLPVVVPRRRRWITVTAGELVVGDVTRSAGSWVRTVTRIRLLDGRVHIGYEDGSTQSMRSDAYMTVDKNSR
jgi:hypothetical protein